MDVVVVVLVFIDWMAFEPLKQTRARFSINLHFQLSLDMWACWRCTSCCKWLLSSNPKLSVWYNFQNHFWHTAIVCTITWRCYICEITV